MGYFEIKPSRAKVRTAGKIQVRIGAPVEFGPERDPEKPRGGTGGRSLKVVTAVDAKSRKAGLVGPAFSHANCHS